MNNNKERKGMENVALKIATVIGLGLVLLIGIFLLMPGNAQADEIKIAEDEKIEMMIIDSPPNPGVDLSETIVNVYPQSAVTLSNVPTSRWTQGCSATSAGMIFGYYDRTGYPNMYTGPANGGVCPLTELGQGTPGDTGYPFAGSCSIIATANGFDGRVTDGHTDDYWIAYGLGGPDPWTGSPPEHTWGDCTADYMGTNQWKWDYLPWPAGDGTIDFNTDGSTALFTSGTGAKLYDYIPAAGYGLPQTALCHGMRLFAESRGYTVVTNYNQETDNVFPGVGFSFAEFQNEIDNGYPVMVQVYEHSMVGIGYDVTPNGGMGTMATNTIYIHDTWDNLVHSMTWGGSYAGRAMEAMTVIHLEQRDFTPPTTTKTVGDPHYGDYVTTGTSITLTATDNAGGSGVKEIHYLINGVETVVPGDTAIFTFSEECTHVLEFWAVDNANNIEQAQIQTHYVDDTPPVTEKDKDGPVYAPDKWALICVSANNFNDVPPEFNKDMDAFPAQGLQAYYELKGHGYLDSHIIFDLWHDDEPVVSDCEPGEDNDGTDEYITIDSATHNWLGGPNGIVGDGDDPVIDADHTTITKALLKSQIQQLAALVGPDDEVVIYLVNHGDKDASDTYFCFETGERVSATEMKTWLTWIKNNCSNMYVWVDTCHSGDFIKTINLPNTCHVAAAGDCKLAWYWKDKRIWPASPYSGSQFFHHFWEKISGGWSCKQAYEFARKQIESGMTVEEKQDPWHNCTKSPDEYHSPVYTEYVKKCTTLISFTSVDEAQGGDPDGCKVGLDYIRYRISLWNEVLSAWDVIQDWTVYTEPFCFQEECKHKLEWYAVDLLGNTEEIHEEIDYVDDTPPNITKIHPEHGYYDPTGNGNSEVVWDNGMYYSGLCASQWDVSQNFDSYQADDFLFDEDQIVRDVHWIGGYWSTDYHLGDFDWCISFYVDDGTGTAPIGHPQTPSYAGPYHYTWDEIHKEVILDDGGSIYYELWVNLPENILFQGGEKYWISIWAEGALFPQSGWGYHFDYLLNPALWGSVTFGYPFWTPGIDVFGYDFDMCFQLTTLIPKYLKCCAPITLIAEDLPEECASGVEGIYWGFTYKGTWHPTNPGDEFDGNIVGYYKHDKYWYEYTKPIHFYEECEHILEYWAIDNFGNQGPIHAQLYYVDNTPPTITKTHPEHGYWPLSAESQKTLYVISDFGYLTGITTLEAYALDVTGTVLTLAGTYTLPYHDGGCVGMALDDVNDKVFTTWERSGTIDVFDATNLNPLTSIVTAGSDLAGIVVDTATNKLYAVDRGQTTIYMYDTVTYADLGTGTIGVGAWGLAFDSANNHLYVTDRTNTVNVYNAATFAWVTSYTVTGGLYSGIAIDFNNPFNIIIYLTEAGGGGFGDKIFKYDTVSGITTTNSDPDGSTGVTVDPQLGMVYMTDGRAGAATTQLRVYDTATMTFQTNINFPIDWIPTDLFIGEVIFDAGYLKVCAPIMLEAIDGGDKVIDQEQLEDGFYWGPGYSLMSDPQPPLNDAQSFIPTVSRLDAVQLWLYTEFLGANVDVTILDSNLNPLGQSESLYVDTGFNLVWFQFHFDPSIPLVPGETYYIAPKSDNPNDAVWWLFADYFDPYPNGNMWAGGIENIDYDYAFKTEYYRQCQSGVEDIYWRYEFEGISYPLATDPRAFNMSIYYPDEPQIADYLWYIYDDLIDIHFNEECRHDLYYFAKDNVCNHGDIHHQIYYVDGTPPDIDVSYEVPGYCPIDIDEGYLRLGSKITLTATDLPIGPCASGVEDIYWRYEFKGVNYPDEPGADITGADFAALYGYTDPNIINYNWYIYDDAADIYFDVECTHELYYFTKDNVCNNGPIYHHTYQVDGNPPVTEKDKEGKVMAPECKNWALICVSTNDFYNGMFNLDTDGFPAQGLQAYYTLKAHGYQDDHIILGLWHDYRGKPCGAYYRPSDDYIYKYYGGPNYRWGPDGIEGTADDPEIDADHDEAYLDGTPMVSKSWLLDQLDYLASVCTDDDIVTIYLVNHGSSAGYHFEDPSSGVLSGTELNAKLNAIPHSNMFIFADMCESGDFLDYVNVNNSCEIGSSTDGWLSWYWPTAYAQTGPSGGYSGSFFFHYFWEKISGGWSVEQAYDYACQHLEYNPFYIDPGVGSQYETVEWIQDPVFNENKDEDYFTPVLEEYVELCHTNITLTAEDEATGDDPNGHMSGVAFIEYRISLWNGEGWDIIQGWTEYTEPFCFQEECTHKLEWRAMDCVGNWEDIHIEIDHVDDTPPETTKTYGRPFYTHGGENYINSSTLISLSATDGPELCASGVKETWYNVSQPQLGIWGEWTLYTDPFTIPNECVHTIYYYSIDWFGNIEDTNSQVVNVDNTPPTTWKEYIEVPLDPVYWEDLTFDFDMTMYVTSYKTTTEQAGFTIPQVFGPDIVLAAPEDIGWLECIADGTTTGDLVGTLSMYNYNSILSFSLGYLGFSRSDFSFDDGAGGFYTGTIVSDDDWISGIQHGKLYGVGSGTNDGKYIVGEFNSDLVVIGLDTFSLIGTTDFHYATYLTTQIQVNINATDLHAPCSVGSYQIFYRINYLGVWGSWIAGPMNSTASFMFTEECEHILEWYVVDDLGQESMHWFQRYYVDDTRPKTTDDSDVEWHDSDVTVTLTAIDPGICASGVAYTYYKVDDGPWEHGPFGGGVSILIPAPPDHSNDGIHVIQYYSVDNVGNKEVDPSCVVKIKTNSQPDIALDQSFTATEYAQASEYSDTTRDDRQAAQSFVPTVENLRKVSLYLSSRYNRPFTLTVEIQTNAKDRWGRDQPSNNVLYSVSKYFTKIPSQPTWIDFDVFATLTPGEKYWIVLKDDDLKSTTNYVKWWQKWSWTGDGETYLDGEKAYSPNNGGYWYPTSSGDRFFKTFGY